MPYCHHCGNQLPEGRDRCPSCGAQRAEVLAGSGNQMGGGGKARGGLGAKAWIWFVISALGGAILLQGLAWIPGVSSHFLNLTQARASVRVPANKVPLEVRGQASDAQGRGAMVQGEPLDLGDFQAYVVARTGDIVFFKKVRLLAIEGSSSVLLTSALVLALLALGLVFLARRPMTAAVSAGAGAAMLLHWMILLLRIGLPDRAIGSGQSLSWPIFIKSSGTLVQSDLVIVSLGTMFLSVLLAGGAAVAAAQVLARISGRHRCPSCGALFEAKGSAVRHCPVCGADISTGKVRWDLAAPAVAVTLALFYGFVLLAGPKLDFYHHCSGANLKESCKTGLAMVRQARHHHNSWVTWWWQADPKHPGDSRMMVVHSAKYVSWAAWIFLLGPLFVAWKGKMRGMATAGATIALSWLGAVLIALFFLDFGMFEGAVLYALKIHVVAGLVWALVGLIGAVIGSRLSSNPFEDMDDETGEDARMGTLGTD